MKSKTVKILILPAAGALILGFSALGTSAFATDTLTPTPSVSPTDTLTPDPSVSPADASSSDEGDLSVTSSDETGVQTILGDQQGENTDVQTILGNLQVENTDVQENDTEVDAVNNDNNSEQASFNEDIGAANQTGNNEDAVQLADSANIVTSVTTPVVDAMVADDTEAQDLITGAPTK